jgi:hypothetical protein
MSDAAKHNPFTGSFATSTETWRILTARGGVGPVRRCAPRRWGVVGVGRGLETARLHVVQGRGVRGVVVLCDPGLAGHNRFQVLHALLEGLPLVLEAGNPILKPVIRFSTARVEVPSS